MHACSCTSQPDQQHAHGDAVQLVPLMDASNVAVLPFMPVAAYVNGTTIDTVPSATLLLADCGVNCKVCETAGVKVHVLVLLTVVLSLQAALAVTVRRFGLLLPVGIEV